LKILSTNRSPKKVKNNKRLIGACVAAMAAGAVQAAPQLDENLRASLQSRVDSGELAAWWSV
jgi:hypothetical protein